MFSILLPSAGTRVQIVSFSCGCSLLVGGLLGVAGTAVGQHWLWATIPILLAISIPVAWHYPHRLAGIYRGWNEFARAVGRLVSWWWSSVAYYIVVFPVSIVGRMPEFRSGAVPGTGWAARQTIPAEAYTSQSEQGASEGKTRRWLRAYIEWARSSQNVWALALLPTVLLIRAFIPHERQSDVPKNIYTLY